MKLILLLALAAHSFAGNESRVPVSALKQVEADTNSQFAGEPWDSLGDARGSYLPGYGAVFTFEMSLIRVTPISPFHMTASAEEVKTVHERKLKQLVVLKQDMQALLMKAASTLAAMPPTEQISFEAYLWSQSFEDHEGLPTRLTMTANRQELLAAAARHATSADLAAMIEERKE